MVRQRAYREDMQCPRCGSNWLPKYGRSRGKQTLSLRSLSVSLHTRQPSASVIREEPESGCGDVHRGYWDCQLSAGCWRKKRRQCIAEGQKKACMARELMVKLSVQRASRQMGQSCARVISFDEMWTYVGARRRDKRRSVWIWTAVVESQTADAGWTLRWETEARSLF